ncbi:MAG: tetratricopeptide repeat protein [Rhodospirillales bacterium]|nr:tetratricopeptide repeat protein [Rhodospirillales bacterium]
MSNLRLHKAVIVSIIASLAISVSACGVIREGGSMLDVKFWEGGPMSGNEAAELGIAEMSKGNYLAAESHFRAALDKNPRDYHALLGAAILYHNTGQLIKAREMYEAVLALRPPESEQFINLNDISTNSVARVASVNLALLESGGVLGNMANSAVGTANQPVAQTMYGVPTTAQSQIGGTPLVSSSVMFPVVDGQSSGLQAMGVTQEPAPTMNSDITGFGGGDKNIISRFTTIRALRDQALITPDEYLTRRQANIGALLPLTSPPPSAGLNRVVPTTLQISDRLHAIGRALEMRAITVSQHTAERSMILDALMPAAPVVVANPGLPPQGIMQAADMVRRMEMLRDAGFITSDEYARERAAIEGAMQPSQPEVNTAGDVMSLSAPSELQPAALSGPQASIHLASYRSNKQAERGWAQLKRAHQNILSDLRHTILEVDLGSKGVYFRLIAGPFSSGDEAKSTCGELKSRRQFCDPTFAEFG